MKNYRQDLVKGVLLALPAAIFVVSTANEAVAGSFAVREQSAYSQGASFAGNATCGDSVQGAFWNPSVITCNDAMAIAENTASFLFLSTDVDTTAATDILTKPDPGDIGKLGVVPSSSFSYAYNENLFFGYTVNGPYGLKLGTPANHNGDAYFRDGEIFSINATPIVGYKINDYISVAAGIQVEYFDLTKFSRQATAAAVNAVGNATNVTLSGDDIGFGFTLGATLMPAEGTEIGIGFRSSIAHTLEGSLVQSGPGGTVSSPISADLDTPEVVTVSLRQRMNDTFTLLGTVEWTNWSRLQIVPVTTTGGATVATFPFSYEDGWFFSIGGEYRYNERLTLRGGVGWEMSPISDESRSLSLPDDDRLWLSVGATYKKDEKWSFNAAYTFITAFNTMIDISTGNPWFAPAQGLYQADVDANVHILSVGFQRKFGGQPMYAMTQ
ncbi:MAG: outer membrane protein transport protein [Rhodobiaceae bacterium]|nr:outer membrane protein transport protein [Rhodobiaceae bacterium]